MKLATTSSRTELFENTVTYAAVLVISVVFQASGNDYSPGLAFDDASG